jgi:uncharacterized membrane protein YdbT with pleckstrin-like domain
MSYIDNNLLPGEQITYRTKKSLIIFLFPIFWVVVIAFFLLHPNPMLHQLAFIPEILAVLFWINQYLVYQFSEFAITNIRILMREGFFYRHTNDTRLAVIANVTVNQSLLGQALSYGTVLINSYGGESDPFRDIHAPVKFQKQLQSQLYSLQQSKPVNL